MVKYWMALSSIRSVGSKTIRLLVSRFGSPEAVLSASVFEIARLPRLNMTLASKIVEVGKDLARFEKLIAQISGSGIDVLCPDSDDYPRLLKTIDNFPPVLYKRGSGELNNDLSVAIVGTRFPTSEGAESARRISAELVKRGFVIISGLAKGIDTSAHKGAVEAGGRTLGVLGCGLKAVYPPENRQLAEEICVRGALISECHPNEQVSSQRLVQRNRIISGVSLGVILVEPEKGALNTANWALKQNRLVLLYDAQGKINSELTQLLPGNIHQIFSMGDLDAVADMLKSKEFSGFTDNSNDQSLLFDF